CSQPATSRFRDAIAAMDPSTLADLKVVPGSLLSQVSALASPETFVWSRLMDAVNSAADPVARDIHARVERWALDEASLSGKLVFQIFQWLYRENRLCGGPLRIRGREVGPSGMRVPVLAVVSTADEIAPRASVTPFLEGMPIDDVRLIEHPGETGVALQHVALLAGHQAYARVW